MWQLVWTYVQHPLVQRLRGITQHGCLVPISSAYGYSRFEHSLGVAYLAWVAAGHLQATPEQRYAVTLAGLLHDVGHGPFSHDLDRLLHEAGSTLTHERRSVDVAHRLIAELDADQPRLPAQVAALIAGRSHPDIPARLTRLISSSGGLDVDRLDYLWRDARFLGEELPPPPVMLAHLTAGGQWGVGEAAYLRVRDRLFDEFYTPGSNELWPQTRIRLFRSLRDAGVMLPRRASTWDVMRMVEPPTHASDQAAATMAGSSTAVASPSSGDSLPAAAEMA